MPAFSSAATWLLMQVKLVDAGFIWTEPHSRRLKTKLTVQSEVFNGAILQQTFVVEYVVEPHMCPDCSKMAANPNQWTSVCQVRHIHWPQWSTNSFGQITVSDDVSGLHKHIWLFAL